MATRKATTTTKANDVVKMTAILFMADDTLNLVASATETEGELRQSVDDNYWGITDMEILSIEVPARPAQPKRTLKLAES